jgi:hypothetical protein
MRSWSDAIVASSRSNDGAGGGVSGAGRLHAAIVTPAIPQTKTVSHLDARITHLRPLS